MEADAAVAARRPTVVASASSPVCDPADPTFVCAKACDAQFAAECADPHASRPLCINDCVSNTVFFNYYRPCGAEWSAYVACVTALPPPAANWDCSFPGFPPQPLSPNCERRARRRLRLPLLLGVGSDTPRPPGRGVATRR